MYVLKHPITNKYMREDGSFTKPNLNSEGIWLFDDKEEAEFEASQVEKYPEEYRLKGKSVTIKKIQLKEI